MTAACPGTVPTVLNGQVTTATASLTTFKEFECLAGFYMTGSKTITCTGASVAVWTDAPTCNVITDNDEIFPEWWLIVAAVILGLAVLACFLCVLCYYCCGRGGHTSVHPYDRAEGGGNCCRDGCGSGCCRGGCGGACCGASTGCCLMASGSRCCPCCCRGAGAGGGGGTGAKKGRARHVANGGQNGVYYVSTPPQGHRTTVVTQPAASKAGVVKGGNKRRVSKAQDTPPSIQEEQPAADGDRVVNAVHTHSHVPTVHSHTHVVHSHSPAVHSHAPAVHSHSPVVHSHAPAVHSHAPVVHSHPTKQVVHSYSTNQLVHGHPTKPLVHSQSTNQLVSADPPCACCEPVVVDQAPGGGWIFVKDGVAYDGVEGGIPYGQHAKDGNGGTLTKKKKKAGNKVPRAWSGDKQSQPASPRSLADVTLDEYGGYGSVEGVRYYVMKDSNEPSAVMDQGTNTERDPGTRLIPSQAGTNASNSTTTNFRSDSSKAWKDYSNNRKALGDGEQPDGPPKQRKAKEVKAWMPHANPVRSFNTSTK